MTDMNSNPDPPSRHHLLRCLRSLLPAEYGIKKLETTDKKQGSCHVGFNLVSCILFPVYNILRVARDSAEVLDATEKYKNKWWIWAKSFFSGFRFPVSGLRTSLCKAAILVFITSFFLIATGTASPNLETYLDIKGVRLYQDHKKNNIWYLSPSPPVLATGEDKIPDASVDIYRYLGRKGTSDSGKFWVKGVLSIGIERDRGKKQLKEIKKILSKTHKIKYPRLRSMPVLKTDGRLIFADADLQWSQGSRWSGKRLTISLDEIKSQILWEAVNAGQTLISIEMSETLFGVKKNKEKQWEDASTAFSSTLPVTLDKAAYPSKFIQTDIGGRMVKGYTGIDVFCFDFLENLDENLYSKVVELAIPTPGNPLVETITFRQDSDCRTRIKFKLSKDLDTAYKIRITRIYNDGSSRTGPWEKRMGEAMLDITDYNDDTSDDNYKE